MQYYSQLDPRWANLTVGNTTLKIARIGCTLVSICMLGSKFFKEYPTPPFAAKQFTFTPDGLIIWTQSDFKGLKFLKRGYNFDLEVIKSYVNHPDRGVILEVNNSHWVWANDVKDSKVSIVDPLDAKQYEDVTKKYKVTGYALFIKDPSFSEETALQWAQKHLSDNNWESEEEANKFRSLARKILEWNS